MDEALAVVIIFSPIIVSVVVRSYGWTVLLADQGPVNWALRTLGLTSSHIPLVFNLTGVVLGLSHVFLPFVVFPIYSSMSRIDPALREAAMDLGAGWWRTFRSITLPLTLPGVVASVQMPSPWHSAPSSRRRCSVGGASLFCRCKSTTRRQTSTGR